MASGTVRFTTGNTAWERIDDGAAYVAGQVEGGSSIKLAYMPSTTAPATLTTADAMTLHTGDQFSFSMGTGESVWILSTSSAARVVVTKRAV